MARNTSRSEKVAKKAATRARRALAMQAELDRASSRGIECCAWMPQL